MRDPLATRALTVAVDAALVLALCDATLAVIDAPALRSLAPWTALAFASGGLTAAFVFPLSLVACAAPSPPRAIARWLAVLAWVAAAVVAVKFHGAIAAIALVVIARRLSSEPRRAGWGRLTGAAFCAVMSVAAVLASHATRAALIESTSVASLVLRPIAARAPWPTIAPANETAPPPAASSEAPALCLVLALDAIAPRAAISMRSTQLVARNGVALIDARRATEGRGALDRWTGEGVVRCSIDGEAALGAFDRCVTAALARSGPLQLAVRVTSESPALADRALQSTLRAAHARTPLSSAIVALTAQAPLSSRWSDVDNDDALVVLSAPGLRPGPARGAVRTDEVPRAIAQFASQGLRSSDPLWLLARRATPWFDRTVRIDSERGGVRTTALHGARTSLTVAPARWGVVLIDHDLDRGATVNRADALSAVTTAWLARLSRVSD